MAPPSPVFFQYLLAMIPQLVFPVFQIFLPVGPGLNFLEEKEPAEQQNELCLGWRAF